MKINIVGARTPMYVCICKAVSERTVRRVVQSGATTVDEVGRRCDAGTCCGACHADIERILADERELARQAEQMAAK